MRKLELHTLFTMLCTAFPNSSIIVQDSNSNPMYIQDRQNGAWQPYHYRSNLSIEPITLNTKSYTAIGVPMSPNYQVCVLLSSEQFSDVNIPIRMVEQLQEAAQELHSSTHEESQTHLYGELQLFFDQLFFASSNSQRTYASLLATKLGIDFSYNRVVCIIHFENLIQRRQSIPINIYRLKKLLNVQEQDIIGPFGLDQIVYCPCIDIATYRRKSFEQLLESCIQGMKKIHQQHIRIGVGLFVKDISEYGHSFLEAQATLQQYTKYTKDIIGFSDDYVIEKILKTIPTQKLHHHLEKRAQLLLKDAQLYLTVEALVRHNMDLYSASEYLGVHRNTIVFRIQKIRDLLQLNPLHKDSDRMLLHLIHAYCHTENRESHHPGITNTSE